MKKTVHIPVLLEASLSKIQPKSGESYLDLTAGYGGHASVFLRKTENYSQSVLVDRDENAVRTLEGFKNRGVEIIHQDFLSAAKDLVLRNQKFDIVFADLGVSSPQLDIAERGFSFRNDGPLDMRMDSSQEKTAEFVVNNYSKKSLVKIFIEYGEEKRGFSEKVALEIVKNRKKNPIKTTGELAELILKIHKGKWQKTHPATKIFQAIRIEVNEELKQVREVMEIIPKLLNPKGRVGIITFHSLEDRIVKEFFKNDSKKGLESKFEIVTKKPVDGAIEDVHNPRSRSAKLRVSIMK